MSERSPSAVELRSISRPELMELYRRLETPSFVEMHGEFAACLLDQGSVLGYLTGAFAVNFKGRWLCKAFEPVAPNEGHGYNSFMTPRGVRRAVRMKTRVGPSKLAGVDGDAFHLEYGPLNNWRTGGPIGAWVHTMFDEVRKVDDGLYLGIGRMGVTRMERDEVRPFLLEGPVAPYRGHDGS